MHLQPHIYKQNWQNNKFQTICIVKHDCKYVKVITTMGNNF